MCIEVMLLDCIWEVPSLTLSQDTSCPDGGLVWYADKYQDSTLCSVDHASLYNLVNETNFMRNLFSVYLINFIYNLYVFRTSPGPSSGGTTIFMRNLVLVILYSWLFGMQDGMISLHPAYQSAGFIYKIRIVLWLGHDCSAPYLFWFMSHVIIWCFIARDTASKIKWIRKYYMESSLRFALFYIFWILSCCSFVGTNIVFTYSVQTVWITCMYKTCLQQLLGFHMFELCCMKAYHVNVDHCNLGVCFSFTFNVCFLSEKYTCSFQVVISREEWRGRQT